MIFHFTLVNYSNGVRSRVDCSVESHVDIGMVAEHTVTSTVTTYVSADPGYSVLLTEIPPLVNENVTDAIRSIRRSIAEASHSTIQHGNNKEVIYKRGPLASDLIMKLTSVSPPKSILLHNNLFLIWLAPRHYHLINVNWSLELSSVKEWLHHY